VQFTITRVAVPDYGAELPLTSEEEGMLGWRQTGFSSQLLDRQQARELEAAIRAELGSRAELVVRLWPLGDG